MYTGFWWGSLRERDHLGDPGVEGRIILRWIFRKWDVKGTDWIDLAETRFRLSAKQTSPFKPARGRQFSRLLAAEVCASAVVMLDTPCSEVA